MTPSSALVVLIAVAAPLLALVITARVQRSRLRAALAVTADVTALPFKPKTEREPSFLLRRFTLPQQTYLAQQYGTARIFFTLCTYILFITAGLGLVPDKVHAASTVSAAQQIWQNYKSQLTVAGYCAEALAFVAAVLVVTTLQTPAYAVFNRTRPLCFWFLFRGRVFIILASLLAATQAAILASILLLILVYGPVWKPAPVDYASIVQLDLSMLTTTALIFSLFVFLLFLPLSWTLLSRNRWIGIFLASMLGSQSVFFFRLFLKTRVARALFLFSARPAPHAYAFALVPLICITGLLFFAERLFARFEI